MAAFKTAMQSFRKRVANVLPHNRLRRGSASQRNLAEARIPPEDVVACVKSIFTACGETGEWNITQVQESLLEIQCSNDLMLVRVDGFTLIDRAVMDDNLELLSVLLNHGCDIDGGISPVNSLPISAPLHLACFLGRVKLIKFLLSHKASVTSKRRLPLESEADHWANLPFCHRGLQFLMGRGQSQKAMFFSIIGKKVECVKLLTHSLSKLSHEEIAQYLVVAIAMKSLDIINILLQCQPKCAKISAFNYTNPLLAAVDAGSPEILQRILQCYPKAGEINEIRSPVGNALSVLYSSLELENNNLYPMTQLLLNYGISVNDGSWSRRRRHRPAPLYYFAQKYFIEGGDIDELDNDKEELPNFPVEDFVPRTLELLLKAGIDINVTRYVYTKPIPTLNLIASSGMHYLRQYCSYHNMYQADEDELHCRQQKCGYGLDTTIKAIQMLLHKGAKINYSPVEETPIQGVFGCLRRFDNTFHMGGAVGKCPITILGELNGRKAFLQLLQVLLDAGADPNMRGNGYALTPLPLLWISVTSHNSEPELDDSVLQGVAAVMDLLLCHGAVLYNCVPDFYVDSNLENIHLWSLGKTLEGTTKIDYLSQAACRILLPVLQQEKALYHRSNQTPRMNGLLRNITVLGLKNPREALVSNYCRLMEMMCNYASHALYHSSLHAALEMLNLTSSTASQKSSPSEEPVIQQYSLISTLATCPRSLQQLCRSRLYHFFHGCRISTVDRLPLPPTIKQSLKHFGSM